MVNDWPRVGDVICDCRYKHVRVARREGDDVFTDDGGCFSIANCGLEPVDDGHAHPTRVIADALPRVDDVELLWATDWWDGPVRGVARRADLHYWFNAVFDETADDYEHPRRLLLFELSPDEVRGETDKHLYFEREIGNTKYCFHLQPEQRHAPQGGARDWAKHPIYRDRRSRPSPYEARPAVGWFTFMRD